MSNPEDVIRCSVDATSEADGDAVAALTVDDAVIDFPGGGVLTGKDGARQFAAKHAEADVGSVIEVRDGLITLAPGLSFARRGRRCAVAD